MVGYLPGHRYLLLDLKALDPLLLPVDRPDLNSGERALILRLAGRRFGSPVAERLAPLLDEQLSDPERIAAVADAVVECETAEEFLARAEKA